MESKVFTLDQTTIKKLLTIFKLVIPDFQRNFVWKKTKKEQLLASLFRGFPIGAITLYENQNAYYIIDGLQRINTLNQYLSRPESIISFEQFYKKAEPDILIFLEEKQLEDRSVSLKKQIKEWYGRLSGLYEFEKVSILYAVLKKGDGQTEKAFESLELVEELLEILKAKIQISYDDIALIIYRGSKEDLPELFKNINTGSVALSQYEILQSVWNDYRLEKSILTDTCEAFERELELIQNDYEISAIKEAGSFDIFKNIVGVNHLICCKEECDSIFKFAGFKRLAEPKTFENGFTKYYENDSIAFELYSALLCNAPNKIVKAIDQIYQESYQEQGPGEAGVRGAGAGEAGERKPGEREARVRGAGAGEAGVRKAGVRDLGEGDPQTKIEEISYFIQKLNHIILEAVDTAIKEVKSRKAELLESKYHALYLPAGIIFSRYDIDVKHLTINKTDPNRKIYEACMDIERHKKEKWFVDENRQVGFFNIKIEELLGLKKGSIPADNQSGILKIRIRDSVISANTVKEFYYKIFDYLNKNFDIRSSIPYATGRKRYLINWTNHHINGDFFFTPIQVGDYYVETHKSRSGAMRDVYNYIKSMGIDVGYVE